MYSHCDQARCVPVFCRIPRVAAKIRLRVRVMLPSEQPTHQDTRQIDDELRAIRASYAGALTALGHTPHAHGSFTRCDGTTASDWAQQVHKSVRRSHASFPSPASVSPPLSLAVCGAKSNAHIYLNTTPLLVWARGQCKLNLAVRSGGRRAEGGGQDCCPVAAV